MRHHAVLAHVRHDACKPHSCPEVDALRLWRSLLFVLFAGLLAACGGGGGTAANPGPPDADTVQGYRIEEGRIVDGSGAAVQLRGINMFGFNSDILIPQYLWEMSWQAQLDQVRELGFNAVRVPFAPDTLYVDTPGYFDPRLNPEFVGKTPLQIFDLWLAGLQARGLYFVLDMHGISRAGATPLWHTDDGGLTYDGRPYSEDDWIRDLRFVAMRYAGLSRFVGIDLYNEPHDAATWGVSQAQPYDADNDWRRAASRAGQAVLAANPQLLVFVEGVAANFDGIGEDLPTNWGENLQPQAYRPLDLPRAKLVLSPHSYGPDVYEKSSFGAKSFPANLGVDWETLFGQFFPDYAVVIGEFGGRYGTGPSGDRDREWQDAFVDYLVDKGIDSGFYWCYTPNSADTGGILNDDLSVNEDKMALLRRWWAG